MPTTTIRWGNPLGPSRSPSRGLWSLSTVRRISRRRMGTSGSPTRPSTVAASPSLPCSTRKRGLSGMSSAPMPYSAAGTASTQYIQRHARTPNHNSFETPPAT